MSYNIVDKDDLVLETVDKAPFLTRLRCIFYPKFTKIDTILNIVIINRFCIKPNGKIEGISMYIYKAKKLGDDILNNLEGGLNEKEETTWN